MIIEKLWALVFPTEKAPKILFIPVGPAKINKLPHITNWEIIPAQSKKYYNYGLLPHSRQLLFYVLHRQNYG